MSESGGIRDTTDPTRNRSRIAIGTDAESALDRAGLIGFTLRVQRTSSSSRPGFRPAGATSPSASSGVLTQRRVIDHCTVFSASCRCC
jgi:hypothetical protein